MAQVREKKRIAVIPGDGIGQEVIPQAVRILEATGAPPSLTVSFLTETL
jgi:isocitrate/isopropylmalate dehydrogenase